VGGEKDGQTWGNYMELIYQDVQLHNKGELQHTVGGAMYLTVGGEKGQRGDLELVVKGARATLLDLDDHTHVKGDRKETVDGNQSLAVGGDQQEKVGGRHALDAGGEIHLKAGTTLVIEAGVQLSLKVGGSFIDIGPAGVSIVGTMVMINSGGSAGSGSGSSPTKPADANETHPVDPTPADDAKTGYKSS
jgi:type VI secretion system secreted protein VgrG